MLTPKDFAAKKDVVLNWIEGYLSSIRDYPVKSSVKPKEIYDLLSDKIPLEGEDFEPIFEDFVQKIIPGITHWQHPNFHAYFPANSSIESLFAEFLTATIGAQCMIWDTSPAAAELEQRMMEWIGGAIGIPKDWEGVIQDTASTATLSALISARERTTNKESNNFGVRNNLRVYASSQTHSSIEKAMGIAGMGRKNLTYLPVDERQSMCLTSAKEAILSDIEKGHTPCAIVVTLGTTGTLAFDDLQGAVELAKEFNLWCHVDAAYAGSALFLEEYKHLMVGIQGADSFVFNPHKWLFTNFDCSAYFVKDAESLIGSFEILPEYLKTKTRGAVNDYRDWGIPLGRRFRSLKLWFVLRSFGLNGIQKTLRNHIQFAQEFERSLIELDAAQIVVPSRLNGVFFRKNRSSSKEENNTENLELIERINNSGKAYITHTKLDDRVVIRIIFGQTYLNKSDVDGLLNTIKEYWDEE